MQKVNLCEACSKEKGVTDPTGFALADLLLGLGAAQEMERGGGVQKCPACGFSQADFKKTGRLGCAACYDTFADGLQTLLKGMHKGTAARRQGADRVSQRSMERGAAAQGTAAQPAQGRGRRRLRIRRADPRPASEQLEADRLTRHGHPQYPHSTPANGCAAKGRTIRSSSSSRVRLARNLRNFAFPGWAKKAERLQILETIKPQVEELPEMTDAHSIYSQDLSALEKQVLVERHLISREHAAKGRRLRGGHEPEADALDHDQRGGSPAHAGHPQRPAAQETSSS